MRLFVPVTVIILSAISFVPGVFAQQPEQEIEGNRLAQTGMKFLSLPVDARSAALGNAVISQGGSSAAIFYNPAGMAGIGGLAHAVLGNVQWISGIQYHAGSAAFRPVDGRYGVFAVSVETVDYGDVQEVIRANNEQGYQKLDKINPTAMAIGVGYARQVTDRFAVGGHAKYARQSLGASVMTLDGDGQTTRSQNDKGTAAFDFGIIYNTGFRSLNFAMSLRNFSREVTYSEESFELPLMLRIGMSMDVVDLTSIDPEMHSLVVSMEGQRPRDYSEQLKTGLEYLFMNTLALRAGYVFPHDEEGVNLGAGLKSDIRGVRFGADYAYTEFGVFGNVNRISVHFAF